MARDKWLNHLAQVPLFENCDTKQLQQVAAATVEITVEPGKVLLREGEAGHECFIIVSGSATVSRNGVAIATLGDGEVIGELAPLTGGPRNATVTIDAPTDLLVLSQQEFNGLLEQVPGFAVRILKNLAQRMVSREEQESA